MIYELREYVAVPGRIDELHARFADHTLDLFGKHNLPVVGFWTDVADPNRIIYLLSFADQDAQRAAWQAFQDDPVWQRVKQESEANGPIVSELHSRTMQATPYWAQAAAGTGQA
jgi:hypothetical protein